ncbi:protein ROS1A-like [Primulina eburnea]|uniref:protein ROS1A-like n=1 Tax=Primulina eburnea TaxID=1245227 RepID=UPI003C6C4791
MAGEWKDDGDWVPVTPAKTVQEYSAVDSGKERDSGDRILGNLSASDACFANVSENSGCNASLGLNGGISDKVEYEETRKDEQLHHNFGSDSTTSKASDIPDRPNSEKFGSCGVSWSKKKRPKMKKHRPKVFDETKPRKPLKSQTVNPLTPKQKTPRRSIPRTSPLYKRKCPRKGNPQEVFDGNLGSANKSCRQELDFNLENHARDQHGHDSCGLIDGATNAKVMKTSFAKDEHVQMVDGFQRPANSSSAHGDAVDQTSYCAVKGFADSMNACTESSLRDSLEDTPKQDVNFNLEMQDFDSCPEIGAIVQRYQRRKKTGSNPLIDGATNAKVMKTSFAKDEHVQMVDGFQRPANSSSAHGDAVDQTSYCAVKGFADSINACTESSLRDSLEDTPKQDVNFNLEMQDFDSCPEIGAIVQRYQRRKKTRSNLLYKEGLEFKEKINTPEEGSKMRYGARFSGLKVYKRMLRPNECLKNSRKLGPNFPSIFKKKRTQRQRAPKFLEKMDPCIKRKVTSTRRSKFDRTVEKIVKRCPSTKLADEMHQKRVMDNELSSDFVMKEFNLRVNQPSQKQIMDAMTDPKYFICAWSSCFRKKRSCNRSRRTKFWCMPEEVKHREPQGCISSLSWSAEHKRKRSNMSAQKRDLSSTYLVPTAFPSKALSVETLDTAQENVEDCAEISGKHIPYLDAHSLIETPIFVGQHLDLKHMFSNLNADEVQGVTDFISQMFERLCISEVNNQLVVRDQKSSGAILPYERKFDPSKRRKLLPKVDLDAETLKAWKFLMETDGSEDIGEGDEETKKYWDSVREMISGRIDSFISCMHHIQGDRRFSPWKGSVVDSVIGVFLTQNVSDHLSSSAFMSLAAKFPPSVNKRSNSSKNNVGHQESIDSNKIACDQSTDRNNEKPCLCSTEQDMRQICSCAKTKTLSVDERSYKDAVQGIQDSPSSKSSTTFSELCTSENSAVLREVLHGEENASHQHINNWEENKISCDQSIVDTEFEDASAGSISCKSPDTISITCTSENSAIIREKVFKVEENVLLQCSHGYEENKMSSGQRTSDTKFGGAVSSIPYSSSHESSTTISRHCTGENSPFYSREENISSCDRCATDVKYGDTATLIPDSSAHKSSTTIAIPCSSENSSIFRETLLVEEDTFLQQYYSHEDNTRSCDKSIAILNFGPSHSDTSALRPDKTSDLDCLTDKSTSILKSGASQSNTCALGSDKTPNLVFNAASCLTRSQNLVTDLGNININGLPNVGKSRESAGGRNKRKVKENQESPVNWDDLRKQYSCGKSNDSVNDNIDSADWEAVRQASVQEVAKVIMDRGMNNILAGRIKDFLDRMIEDHGTIDLEWLRDVPPDKAKNYLLSIPGLGLKSTECVRLLTLRHHAFPVDTNVGRILVRLGWVPLLPLPEDVQIHLLNNYPLVDTIQKYIWPRLCKISNETLYECHYQMITFGKVFCTKRQPNCNACPMRGQCRHFASAYASARLRLPGVQGGSNEDEPQVKSSQNVTDTNPPLLVHCDDDVSRVGDICFNSEPIVEFPSSPEPASIEMAERDIEDFGYESEDEIPTIKLNQVEFTKNLLDFMEKTNFLNGEGNMSKELVALSPEAASIPMPKLKSVGRLRTVHQVYEVPDSHPLLAGFEKREPDDPCPYLLAIWTNGACSCQESITCDVGTCCLRDEVQKQNEELIQGTMLIPCRTANRGSFPLNGTYFQVNEVFADHESSLRPISVPRKWIWNFRRRSLYCGTSTTSIFRGMTTDEIQYCFWRGFICVRATDRVTRAPKPLARRFHICKTRVVGDE